MPRPRDAQRAKVFEAEKSLTGAPVVHGIDEATAWLQSVGTTRFWTNLVLDSKTPYVYQWRDNMHACKQKRVGVETLPCLPIIKSGCVYARAEGETSVFELIHQLAHFVTFNDNDQAWHDVKFVQAYAAITKRVLGDEWAKKVREAFRVNRVKQKRYSEESRKASSERWYQQQATMAPNKLREMIAELEQ